MDEDKKLDEKTLEEVSGGADHLTFWEAMDYNNFIADNCSHCSQKNCFYGNKYNAFRALGGGKCTKREAL